ncbi:MAG TPA: hypothetical protein VFQ35_04805 [Polyangiaceae bacterium]|nr:hypothetical protein [Polyangiaceae bacterium]
MAKARRLRSRPLLVLASALVACGVTALPASVHAEPRVLIEVPDTSDPVLTEALNRVRGELSAVGLDADVHPFHGEAPEPVLESGVEGALSLERENSIIRIRAWGPLSPEPVVQELDTRASDVTAEVVSVRAVEALRAVTVAFRKREPKPVEPPKPPPRPEPPPPPPPKPVPRKVARPALAPRGEHGALTFTLAPNSFYDVDSRTLGVGGEVGAYYGRFPCFVGPQLTSTLYRPALRVDAGTVDTKRLSAALRAGCSLELGGAFELWVSLGGGLARYDVEGHPASGFRGNRVQHSSPFLTSGVGASLWFSTHVGVFARVDASVATDTAAIRVLGAEIASLEKPLLWGAVGIALQVPSVL